MKTSDYLEQRIAAAPHKWTIERPNGETLICICQRDPIEAERDLFRSATQNSKPVPSVLEQHHHSSLAPMVSSAGQ